MSYTINKTDGTIFATIADGTVDNSSDLTLVGKNYAGYGEILNENFIRLMENFANSTAPTKPIEGQLWWDVTNSMIKVYVSDTVGFKNLGKITNSASVPSNNVISDLWWDSTNRQLKVYDGTGFVVVGPNTPSSFGSTGAQPELIVDTAAGNHYVVSLYAFTTRVAIISKDAEFTPATPVAGFPIIRPGINLAVSGVIPGIQLIGTASNAELLDNLNSTDFIRANINATTSGTLGVSNDTGLAVGVDSDFRVSVSGPNVTVENQTTNGNLNLRAAGNASPTVSLNGTTGLTTVLTDTGFAVGVDRDFKVSVTGSSVILENQTLNGSLNFKVTGNASPAISVNGATGLATVLADPTTALGIATKSYTDNVASALGALNRSGTNTITGVIVPDTDGTIDFGSSSRRFGTIHTVGLSVSGNLTVNGTTTTINSTTVSIDDKNIVLGDTPSPTDSAADGGGITLKGTTDKTITWQNSTGRWTFNTGVQATAFYGDGSTLSNLPGAGVARYESSVQTLPSYPGGKITVNHGGPRKPDIIRVVMRRNSVTAPVNTVDASFAAGDEVDLTDMVISSNNVTTIWANATQIGYSGFLFPPNISYKEGNYNGNVTPTYWNLVFYAIWV